jgi:hypothetical protein
LAEVAQGNSGNFSANVFNWDISIPYIPLVVGDPQALVFTPANSTASDEITHSQPGDLTLITLTNTQDQATLSFYIIASEFNDASTILSAPGVLQNQGYATLTSVPESPTCVLLEIGLAGLAVFRRKLSASRG